jgi:hypothetical protein
MVDRLRARGQFDDHVGTLAIIDQTRALAQ